MTDSHKPHTKAEPASKAEAQPGGQPPPAVSLAPPCALAYTGHITVNYVVDGYRITTDQKWPWESPTMYGALDGLNASMTSHYNGMGSIRPFNGDNPYLEGRLPAIVMVGDHGEPLGVLHAGPSGFLTESGIITAVRSIRQCQP